MPASDSPDDEITFRSRSGKRTPSFKGVGSLPASLTELCGTKLNQMPSRCEFSALASRLRRVHIDDTPQSKHTGEQSSGIPTIKPARLAFDDDEHEDKENCRASSQMRELVQESEDNNARVDKALPTSIDRQSAERNQSEINIKPSIPVNLSLLEEKHETPKEISSAPEETPSDEINLTTKSTTRETSEIKTIIANSKSSDVSRSVQPQSLILIEDEKDQQSESSAPGSSKSTEENCETSCNSIKMPSVADALQSVSEGLRKAEEAITPTVEKTISTEGKAEERRSASDDLDLKNDTNNGNTEKTLATNFRKIVEGNVLWIWHERCAALEVLQDTLSDDETSTSVNFFSKNIQKLIPALIEHLDEARPNVIKGALALINAVVTSGAAESTDFCERLFSEVLDIACGRSLTAQDAALSIAIFLANENSLKVKLQHADNPCRLLQLLEKDLATGNRISETNEDLRKAIEAVKEVAFASPSDAGVPSSKADASHLDADVPISSGEPKTSYSGSDASPEKKTDTGFQIESMKKSGPFPEGFEQKLPEYEGSKSNVSMKKTSPKMELGGSKGVFDKGSSPRDRSCTPSPNPILRNKRLSSARKLSPGALRKHRMYSQEDIDEAKRVAAAEAVREVKDVYEKEKKELEQKIESETKEKRDLHSVLSEYEKTISNLAAQGKERDDTCHAILDSEVSRLKTELFEATDAFNKLKVKYAESKETIAVFEGKEARIVEQNHELRKSLIELQKWSNDLKTNSEKKLAKAFENVSQYRSTFLDREARANKAMSELKMANEHLEKQKLANTEIGTKLAQVETMLHAEQDARASLQSSLADVKLSLQEVTKDRDNLREELRKAHKDHGTVALELEKLRESESRNTEAAKKLASIEQETRALKASAYDYMSKNRELELKLAAKDKECDELNAICEELLSNLEKAKA